MAALEQYEHTYLVYSRKSTDDAENQKNSLAYQRLRCSEYSEYEGLPLARGLTIQGFCEDGFIDERHSAFKEDDEFFVGGDGMVGYRVLRPKFLRLVELLKAREVKGVIFLCWDRASRNKHDDLLLQRLMRVGCDIRFADTAYEKGSAGTLHMNIDGLFSAHFSNVIGEKVRNAYRKLHAEGRCTYHSPIGYLDQGSDRKVLDPERAPIVKRIFELYATGDWSFVELAKWAREQGLTKKPARRKRTPAERLNNVELDALPRVARPVDHKTIEYIVSNPFYIGMLKVEGRYIPSNAHEPLVNAGLFNRVQVMLSHRRRSVHYVDKPFYLYRGLLRCVCRRSYSPYEQKGIVYYRSRCRPGCANSDPNLTEDDVHQAIQTLLNRAPFSDEELAELERRAPEALRSITDEWNGRFTDLQVKQRRAQADLDYLAENKIALLRTGAMTPEDVLIEQERLTARLSAIAAELKACSADAPALLRAIVGFSGLARHAATYFGMALDTHKKDVAFAAFTELTFSERKLVKYDSKDGFGCLLRRFDLSGSPDYLFFELLDVHSRTQASTVRLSDLGFFEDIGRAASMTFTISPKSSKSMYAIRKAHQPRSRPSPDCPDKARQSRDQRGKGQDQRGRKDQHGHTSA